MRTVVMVGAHAPYEGEKTPETEIWCINRGFRNQDGCDRVYMMDTLEAFWKSEHRRTQFLDEVNGASWRVILREHRDEIPRSERFPIEDLLTRLPHPFFTCTLAYMVAQAIRERFERIVMHRIYVLPQSSEYFEQLPCIDFWLGLAIGQGIRVEVSEDSDLCRSFPWQPRLYGYAPDNKPSSITVALSRVVEDHAHDPITYGLESAAICELANEARGVKRYEVRRNVTWKDHATMTAKLRAEGVLP